MASLELEQVTVRHGGLTVLDAVDLVVGDGELVAIVGATGSGKSTLLRAIAGLDRLSGGRVYVGGADVSSLPTSERNLAMVFQNPMLWKHRDVHGNIAFPLEVRHTPADEIRTRVGAEVRALHIEGLLRRSPATLSPGESQLVHIARAMVRVPSALLLDEVLAPLDAPVRQRMRVELRQLQLGYGVTALLTTNDPAEAMSMPDRVVVLDAGRVVQVGAPMEVHRQPRSLVAAAATGEMSTMDVTVAADADGFWLVHPSFRHRAWRPGLSAHLGRSVTMMLRPGSVTIADDGPVPAETVDAVVSGSWVSIKCRIGADVVAVSPSGRPARTGSVRLRIDEYTLFDPASGRAID